MTKRAYIFIILATCFFSTPIIASTNPRPANVLLLYSYHIEGKGSMNFDKGVRSAFKDASLPVRYHTEYMDTIRFTDAAYEQHLFDFYEKKYKETKIDIIITYASPALDFLLKYGQKIFPDVPVVVGLVSETVLKKRPLPDHYTAILSGPQFASTLTAALKLLPGTKNVVIVGGTSPVDRQYFTAAKQQLVPFQNKINIEYINQLAMKDLLKKTASLPSHTIIIYSLLQQDAQGKVFGPKSVARQIAKASSVPVFGISQTHLGTGIVGGVLNSTHLIGRKSAEISVKLLKQTKITTHQGGTHAYLFDWEQLKRWGLDEKKLPQGSVVWNKKLTVWEQYRKQIMIAVLLIIFETVLIALLLINWAKRIATEQDLKKSEAKYRSMMESITDPLVICSSTLKVEYMNPAMIERFGRDATGEACYKTSPDLNQKCDWCLSSKASEHEFQKTGIVSLGDGRRYRVTNMPIQKKGKTVSQMRIYRDVTQYLQAVEEKEKVQEQLRQAQKMKSIGTLAGGIAHDFNNILYPVIGFVQLSIDELPENHPVQENLYDILEGAKRASELVKRILMFSRQKKQDLKPTNIKPVIQETLKLLRSSIPVNIEIQMHYYDGTDLILCDETEIHEIIMNLCTNSYHAIGSSGGMIKIELKKIKPPADLNLSDAEHLCLSVSDNGSGIAPEIRQNIFEPYFTTKEIGKGSGLGLSVVHGIVKNYQGEIDVKSHPGTGTTFNIFLPITSKPVGIQNRQNDISPASGTGRILMVDDDESIVKLGVKSLERAGYTVTGTHSSVKALNLIKSRPDAFDLVITDMTMPEMLGTQLAEKISQIHPGMPIILCSGFSETLEQAEARLLNIKAYIDKPILIEELTASVKKALKENQDIDNPART